jgi:glycolate oxidase iron-sulfur subunit
VDYGHLLDIGRKLVDAKVPRPATERAVRWALKEGIPSPLFGPAMAMGQLVRPLLPTALKAKVPAKQDAGAWPNRTHSRKVLMLAGCAQPAMGPNINTATARVLDAVGIQTIVATKAGCCGAVKFHLNDQVGGKAEMRANIDAWWPHLQSGAEAIVMNASGCGVTVKEYGHILKDDPVYAEKARQISALTKDLSELLPMLAQSLQDAAPALAERIAKTAPKLVFHPPCSLQHGQKLKGGVEQHLGAMGFSIRTANNESHLCCGSAGTFSVLNPDLAYQLRDRKLGHLGAQPSEVIVSANMGCITHLQTGTPTPVRHWVEVLDAVLATA